MVPFESSLRDTCRIGPMRMSSRKTAIDKVGGGSSQLGQRTRRRDLNCGDLSCRSYEKPSFKETRRSFHCTSYPIHLCNSEMEAEHTCRGCKNCPIRRRAPCGVCP